MSNPYSAFCDDFYVNLRLGSQLALPHQRDTLLTFFERIQKSFPAMRRFRKTEAGEFNLEEPKSSNSYRWVSVEAKRLVAGHVNPESVEEALKLHTLALELAPYQLGISPIELEYIEVLFGFDLTFTGNHDEIIADSLLTESPLTCLTEEPYARPVDVQPTVTVSLSEDCRLQARIDVVTRTNSYQVRTGEYSEDVISVYLMVRRFWGDRPKETLEAVFAQLAEKAQELTERYILQRVLRPISSAIASRS